MDGGRQPNRCFRFSPMDRLGRKICPSVLDAAEEIGRRAIEHAETSSLIPQWRRVYWRLLPVFRARSRGKRTALRTWFEAFRRISSVLSSGA